MPFAIGKASASTLVESATNAYGVDGMRFYYTDERHPYSGPTGADVDGCGHADMYWQTANEREQDKWLVSFTKDGTRYEFPGVDFKGKQRWE
ncbi:hypothetical protein N7470_001054 [Penicillium chermesinum]|nr:hypothetical protein N7470_001054 [Penicillium chermesinum]